MKYADEQYLSADYFEPDEELTHYKKQIVTTRTPHRCSSIAGGKSHEIAPKTKVILETAIHVDDGRVSNYVCLPCADKYLDEVAMYL